jgi:CRISPR-associated protein Csx17
MDAVLVMKANGEPAYPALLGTGGNDGRFDFTNNFMQRVVALFDCADALGPATADARIELDQCLWGTAIQSKQSATMGQFDPSSVGGANSGNGFDGKAVTNAWDFLLLLEGAVCLTSSATRRLAASAPSQGSAPFAVRSAAAGYGSATGADEDARGEQWMPLWQQPASFTEVTALFAAGRATLGSEDARGAVDLARSIARLGTTRGISSFERYGYIERNGQARLATPLGRWTVTPRGRQSLLDEVVPWVRALRRASDADGSPASLGRVVRSLESAILACAGAARASDWSHLCVTLGEAEQQLVRSPRFTVAQRLDPLPTLTGEWLEVLDLNNPAVRLALSLAFMVVPEHHAGLRRHALPLDAQKPGRRARFAVVGDSLAQDPDVVVSTWKDPTALRGILLRRVVLAARGAGTTLELTHQGPSALLTDVESWLAGDIGATDVQVHLPVLLAVDRAAAARAETLLRSRVDSVRPPSLFSLLRTATPHSKADVEALSADNLRVEPALVHALAAGRVPDAAATAVRRLRAAGRVPTLTTGVATPAQADRLLAALLFPLSGRALGMLARDVTLAPSASVHDDTRPAGATQEIS